MRLLEHDDFEWAGDGWTVDLQLPPWGDYCVSVGPGSKLKGRRRRGDATVELNVIPADVTDGAEELGAYRIAHANWAIQNHARTVRPVLRSILAWYREIRPRYIASGFVEHDAMPSVRTQRALRDLVALDTLLLHPVPSAVPYLGFQFSTSWDREHGAGVMMHGRREVKVGGADTALLTWIAERDAASHR